MAKGVLTVKVMGDDAHLRKTLDNVSGSVGRFGSALGKSLGVGAVAAGAAMTAFAVTGVKSLARIERINTQTAAAIKSTGAAAKVNAKHVEDLAGSLENLTTVEAETVQEGANLLLTFTQIQNKAGKGNDIFDQATKTMVDMSVALGQDTKSSAIQLGKALNDPIKGVTALQRVGVSFTGDQKKQIETLVKSGKTMDAQKLILAELNKEFGGSGAAQAQTYEGKLKLLGHAFGTIQENIMTAAMPYLKKFADFLLQNMPTIEKVMKKVADGVGAAFTGLVAVIRPVAKFIGDVWKGLTDPGRMATGGVTDAVVQVFARIIEAARKALAFVREVWAGITNPERMATGGAADVVVQVFYKIKAAVEAVAQVMGKVWGVVAKHMDVVKYAVLGLAAAFTAFKVIGAVQAAVAALSAAFAVLTAPITLVVVAIGGLVAALIYAYRHSETFRDVVNKAFAAVSAFIRDAWTNTIRPLLVAWGVFITQTLIPALRYLWQIVVKYVFPAMAAAVKAYWAMAYPILKALWGFIRNSLVPAFVYLLTHVNDAWAGLKSGASSAWSSVKNTILGALRAIASPVGRFLGAMAGVAKAVGATGIAGRLNSVAATFGTVGLQSGPSASEAKKRNTGGFIPGGGPDRDSVLSYLTPGEFVIRRRAADRLPASFLHALNDPNTDLNKLGDLPKYAGGGRVSSQKRSYKKTPAEVLAWARTQAGKPYQWGGYGNPSFDCSGFMGALSDIAAVGHLVGRAWSTADAGGSFLGRFVRGAGNPQTGFSIGVRRGNVNSRQGAIGHTAGTIAGVNVESSSGGVKVGGRARGSSYGDLKYFLPDFGGGADILGMFKKLWDAFKEVKAIITDTVGGLFPKAAVEMGKEAAKSLAGKVPGGYTAVKAAGMEFDSGGYLKPGASIVQNRTGRPEPVLTQEQWKALIERPSSNVTVNIQQVVANDPRQFVDQLRRELRGYNLRLA